MMSYCVSCISLTDQNFHCLEAIVSLIGSLVRGQLGLISILLDWIIIIVIGYIASLVEFVLKLKILPEILEKCWEWAVSTWNWSTDHTSTTRLYSSKQCIEIVRGQRQGLDESLRSHCRGPTPPCIPRHPLLMQFQLVLGSALTPQNMAVTELLISEGESKREMKPRLKLQDETAGNVDTF